MLRYQYDIASHDLRYGLERTFVLIEFSTTPCYIWTFGGRNLVYERALTARVAAPDDVQRPALRYVSCLRSPSEGISFSNESFEK